MSILQTRFSQSLVRGLRPAAKPLIGFDIGFEKINLVQVDTQYPGYRILAAASDYHNANATELVSNPKVFRRLIQHALKSNPFQGRRAVAAVPQTLLNNIYVNFQCRNHENEAQALLTALKTRVNEDLNQYVIDYLPIKPQSNEQIDRAALVVLARKQAVEDFLDVMTYTGLMIEALEIGPIAIKRLITAITRINDGTQKVLSINFGVDRSYLTVIWNDQLMVDRKIDFGIQTVINAIAKAFDVNTQTALSVLHQYGLNQHAPVPQTLEAIDEEDAADNSISTVMLDVLMPSFYQLATAIKDVLVYVASETRGGAVEQIFLMGSLARLQNVDQILNELISVPVHTINPFYGMAYDRQDNPLKDVGPLAGIAVATGLSLRGSV